MAKIDEAIMQIKSFIRNTEEEIASAEKIMQEAKNTESFQDFSNTYARRERAMQIKGQNILLLKLLSE